MVHPSTPTPGLNMLWKDSFKTPLRQVLMYLWKAACDRFNKRKEKKEERIKREVRRMGRNAKRFFVLSSLFTTLIIIMVTFKQGTKEHTVEAYTRQAPKLQQVIFKLYSSIGQHVHLCGNNGINPHDHALHRLT
jgi:hypothetical protein